jgi:hypothetical protein
MIKKVIPDNSPLIFNTLICSACGGKIEPKVNKSSMGKVQSLLYKHINEEYGCRYTLETNTMIQAEMRPLREDGTEAKIPQ